MTFTVKRAAGRPDALITCDHDGCEAKVGGRYGWDEKKWAREHGWTLDVPVRARWPRRKPRLTDFCPEHADDARSGSAGGGR